MNMSPNSFNSPKPGSAEPGSETAWPWPRLAKWGAGVVFVAGACWLLWQWANDMSGVRREAPKVPMIVPLPPPPPPPPEPETPPEPEEPVEEEVVDPEPEPEPEMEQITPEDEAPSPADDLADPMQMDADAQAGSDAFNIGSGKGSGMSGSGGGRLGNGTYKQYLSYAFQKLLRESPELRNLAFRIQADVWLNTAGDITRVELIRSSGDEELDAKLLSTLRAAPRFQERPPASLTIPVRLDFRGRRPS